MADLEDGKCDAKDIDSSLNFIEKTLNLNTLDKEEGTKFHEGGIRGWTAVLGA